MKKCIFAITSVLLLGTLFLSCNFLDKDDDSPAVGGTAYTPTGGTSTLSTSKVKFDFSDAKAVAKLESGSGSSSRAATNADNLSDFVKILADGSMKNAITVDGYSNLSDIRGIYKSPLESSGDVFVEFSSQSYLGWDSATNKNLSFGQLICVHADGTIADILKIENNSNQYNYNGNYMSLQSGSIKFDASGNLYFIASTYNSTGSSSVIYQFNPLTNKITEMVAAVEGTWYSKMQIDKTGQWVFVSGSRNSSYFLRAIPISNPNNFVNIYYVSSGSPCMEWVYDDNSGVMYYLASSGNNRGLFTATKKGGFKDKTFRRTYVNKGHEKAFVTYDNSTSTYKFNSDFYVNDTLDSSKVLEYMFSFCDVDGEKEFRLSELQNDSDWDYRNLYNGELKDTEAIEWIVADPNKLYYLRSCCGLNDWEYNQFFNFLSKTCFIKGTNTKATSLNSDFPSIQYGEGFDITSLSINENGLFGIYSNIYNNLSSTGVPYFYIIHIADSQGNLVENVRKPNLPNGKVVGSVNNNKKLIMKYSLMDSSGGELGYHHIYAADLDSGDVTNCFDNVPNRNSLEVVSFSSAGDFLYYSAVRGTAVENGIVNIVTNEYNPLTIKRKMVAVYAF